MSITNFQTLGQTAKVTRTSTSTGRSFYGDPTYVSNTTTYPARWVYKRRLVVDNQGREQVSRGVVWLGQSSTGGLPILDTNDKIASSSGATPKILDVEIYPDRNGKTHHVKVVLG